MDFRVAVGNPHLKNLYSEKTYDGKLAKRKSNAQEQEILPVEEPKMMDDSFKKGASLNNYNFKSNKVPTLK
jgi:hypothetical protein